MVFLSTTAGSTKFVPAAEYDSSCRVYTRTLRHYTPICGLGYDLMVGDLVDEGRYGLHHFASSENMSRFGRPL